MENSPVQRLAFCPDGVAVTIADGTVMQADKLVLCHGTGGAGSAGSAGSVGDAGGEGGVKIDGMPADIAASRAVRGVNLLVDQSGLDQPITHLIKHHRGNLCPRENNQLIVGTTYESDQWSLDPGPDVVEFLYNNAEPVFPMVRQLPLLRVTAGLRSKVGDGNLRLGRSVEQPQLYYSLSHGGAGFLRAPVIGDELAEFVLNGVRGPLTYHHTHG